MWIHLHQFQLWSSSSHSRFNINRETWIFWHRECCISEIDENLVEILKWDIRCVYVLVVCGCIYHERVKSRSHSCDNHLDIHRREDKNWKWLVKTIFLSLIFHWLCVCAMLWIDQLKPHPQQDISCEVWYRVSS